MISKAIKFASDCAKGNLMEKARAEFSAAKKAGWDDLLRSISQGTQKVNKEREVTPPLKKPVTDPIPGIEVMQLEDAVQALWKVSIYAECGMGCTGPIVLIAPEDREKALEILKKDEFI